MEELSVRREFIRTVSLIDTESGKGRHKHFHAELKPRGEIEKNVDGADYNVIVSEWEDDKHELFERASRHYLATLLLYIPSFNTTGSVLLQTTGEHNPWLKEWGGCKSEPTYLCSVIALPGIDAAFSVSQHYPHTRSSNPSIFAGNLILMLLLAFFVLALMRISLPRLVPNLTLEVVHGEPPDPINEKEKELLEHQKQMVMSNLAYFGLANPRNRDALDALLAEGSITENRLGYEIDPSVDTEQVRREMSKEKLIEAARQEGEGAWRHVKAPLILLMLGALVFTIYAAQEELSSILQVVGSIGAVLVTAKSVLDNFRGDA